MKKLIIMLSMALIVAVGLILPSALVTAQGYQNSCIGAGTIGMNRDPRVVFACNLQSNVDQLPNILNVNWGGDRFNLDVLTAVQFSDDPTIDPRPPRAGADTVHGWGVGKYNGVDGYQAEFIFTDAGEPGRVDSAWMKITDLNGDTVMEYSGLLHFGNINMLNA